MSGYEKPLDRDAVFFELQSRQLVSRIQAHRDRLMELKEEASTLVTQQWPRSKKEKLSELLALIDLGLGAISDEMSTVLYHIRYLQALGRGDTNVGQTEEDL